MMRKRVVRIDRVPSPFTNLSSLYGTEFDIRKKALLSIRGPWFGERTTVSQRTCCVV